MIEDGVSSFDIKDLAMRPGKILLGQVMVVFVLIVLTIWGATQWTAYVFGYQPALGHPWFFAGEMPVYKPWRLFQWWYAYEAYAPDVFARAGLIASSGGLLGIFAAVVGSVIRSRDAANVTTYGSARWAKQRRGTTGSRLGKGGMRWRCLRRASGASTGRSLKTRTF